MGVHNLWDLLTSTALPVRVESLFGKVCCIDASFWICHCLASESNMRHGGDIIGVFFLRICYLLDKGINPVFVFDGKTPYAKMKTILRRRMINQRLETNHKLLAYKLLASQMSTNNQCKISNSTTYRPSDDISSKTETSFSDESMDDMEEKTESILELFPEEVITNSEKLDSQIQMLKDCDYLSAKAKYELMNAVRDNIIQKDREESMNLKGHIDEYSSHQINSYMRDVKINREIEKLKSEMYQNYFPGLQQNQPLTFKNSLSEEICDYNEYFNKKYKYDIEPIKSNSNKFNYNFVDTDHSVDDSVDESLLDTDEQLFGEEMLEGIDTSSFVKNKISNCNNKNQYSIDTTEICKRLEDQSLNKECSIHDNTPKNSQDNEKEDNKYMYDNDYFLNIYKKHCKLIISNKSETVSDLSDIDMDFGYSNSECDDPGNDSYESKLYTIKPITEHTEKHGIRHHQKHHYYEDVQQLLKLFGVPYLVAPSEAESQCAYMNRKGFCYAVISDDSDSLVFGAKLLLKNFYNDNIFELYSSDRIFKELGIGREQLALIAVICGCDYTNGIRGIGIVNALEVIKAYPTFNDLYEFKKWATTDCNIKSATYDECPIRSAYKKAHINYRVHWTFSPDFPNEEAYKLFLKPNVTNRFNLEWTRPNMQSVEEYMSKKSALPKDQVKECLNMLQVRKSIQFIMEDVAPEITAVPFKKSSVKTYRKNMNTNLSAFRKVLSNLGNKSKFNINTKLVFDQSRTLSKIRSKRMIDSIRVIRQRNLLI